jgi:hypothetical protein
MRLLMIMLSFTRFSDDVQSKVFIPARQTTFAYYKIHRAEVADNQEVPPEKWTSDALERLLTNSQTNERPPPVQLHVTDLSFVS